LPAPQAALISALAKGVIEGQLDWKLIETGIALGAVVIVADALLGRAGLLRLPPLAVGLGVYLPLDTTLMVVVGSLVGWVYERQASRRSDAKSAKQLGVLLASGLIVGESLIGILVAALVVFSGKDAPLALVGEGFAGAAMWIGGAAFAVTVASLYAWLSRLRAAPAPT
jgi:putative OPT family oligopeptide transporter